MNFTIGCIFEYNDAYPEESGIGFKKEHSPNFTGSFYSKTKTPILSTIVHHSPKHDLLCLQIL